MSSRSRSAAVIGSLLAVAAMAGCAGPVGSYVWVQNWEPPATKEEYVIKAGDTLDVRVFNQDQLSGRWKVRSDGKLTLPFLNDVVAAGLTPQVLSQQLQTRLKDFINSPVVTVIAEEAARDPISILGQVKQPGQYTLEAGAGVLQALARAGGFTDFAHRDRIFVIRRDPQPIRIRFTYDSLVRSEGKAAEFTLEGGDAVVVE